MRRDLWRMRWRALAIVLTLASGIAVHAGVYMGARSLFWTRDTIYAELNFADLEVRFLADDVGNLPSLSALPGVRRVERRLVLSGTLPGREAAPLAVVMTFLERPTPGIHSFRFVAGRPFRADELDAVVVDVSLATYHGYRVGDVLEVRVGEARYPSRVVGIAITPEYFVSTSNPTFFIPEKGSLGFVFGNSGRVADSLGFTLANDLLFLFEEGAAAGAVKQAVLERLGKRSIEQVIPRERHFSHRYVQTQFDGIRVFIPALVAVLMALSFVIVAVNFNRMVAAERREIGALMALGYGRGTLLRSYLEASLVLGAAGALVGLASSLWLRDLFATLSGRAMGMPDIRLTTDPAAMAQAVAYGIAIALVAAAVPVLRLLRLPPQQVIREPVAGPPRWARSAAGRAPRSWGLPASHRYALRNLARQRARTVVTLGSIALALAVATSYRLSHGAVEATLHRWLEGDRWDLSVDFLYPVFRERVDEIGSGVGAARAEPYFTCYAQIRAGARSEDATVVGIEPDSRLVTLDVVEGHGLRRGPEREAILTRGLAATLGVGVGDRLRLETADGAAAARLAGLSWAAVASLAIVPLDLAQDVCQFPDKATGAYVQTGGDPRHASARLYESEFVGKVLAKQDLVEQIRQVHSVMLVVLNLATAMSLFVAALVILTSVNLSVLEHEREFATLRAIGYGPRLIARIVLTEAGMYAAGAFVLSIPVAVAISGYLNHRIATAWIQVDPVFPLAAFAVVLGPGLLLIPIAAYPGVRHVARGDVVHRIRARVAE
jgi:putative ABC transport system permease protein